MRSCLLALLALSVPSLSQAQEFTTPMDVVSTLYGTYFLNVPLTDISPYFSDELTDRLGGTTIGHDQFRAAGIDPLTGRLNWDPRGFKLALVEQTADAAEIKASFQDGLTTISVTFDLVREHMHGWQIDHISGEAGDQTWCTNSIVSMADP